MAIKLKCPACRDTVLGAEADRGTSIKCGTCWADVPVPKADADADIVPATVVPAVPVAKAVPATAKPVPAQPAGPAPVAQALPLDGSKPPTATALPLDAPTAKPVAAKPATLNPIDARNRDRDDDGKRRGRDKERPRFKGRDEDDDDDRPIRSKESSGGGKGILIAFLCIGFLMLAGLAGGAYLLLRGGSDTVETGPGPETVNNNPGGNNVNPPNPNAGANPNLLGNRGDFDPNPPGIKPGVKPAAPAGWVEFQGKGFAVSAPAKMAKGTNTFGHGEKFFTGDKYEAKEGGHLEVSAQELDKPDGVSVTTPEFVAAATFNTADKVRKTVGRPMAHGPGVEFATNEVRGDTGAVLVTQTANKVYVFHIRWRPTLADGPKRRDEFFASVRLLGVEADGPDVVAGGGRVRPNRPNRIGPPELQPVPAPVDKPWVELEAKAGFTVLGPAAKGAKPEAFLVQPQQGVRIGGRKYLLEDDVCQYHAVYFDLPPDYDPDVKKLLVNPVVPHFNTASEAEAVKVGGKDGVKLDIRQHHGLMQRGVSVKVGHRLFCFCVIAKHVFTRGDDPTFKDRTDKFLDSVKVSFDPKTTDPYADEPKWVPLAKATGFAVLVPKNATAVNDKPVGYGVVAELVTGKEYVTDVDGIAYTVTVHPVTPKLTADKIANELRGRDAVLNSGRVKVNGLEMESYELKHAFGHTTLFRATAVGRAVYTLRVARTDVFGNQVGDKELADKAAKFLDSFRLGDAVAGGGEVGMGGASGDFAVLAAGKVKPFWAAVFLTEKKELITVGVKDANATPAGGVLRRYSVPDFKLKATYHLSHPAHKAAADEKGGKLYLASVSAAADAKLNEREAAAVGGDVQVFDLKKLTDGTLGELDEVKPTTTHFVGSRIAGLEVSPAGDAVYVGCVTQSGTKQRPVYRGKLMKFDTATGKPQTELASDSPVWAMRLSADGRRLAVIERATDATGGPRGGGTLILLDAPNWKRIKSAPLSGVPLDVTLLGERAAALEGALGADGAVKLTVMSEDGETAEVPVGGNARYAKATREGKKLLVSFAAPENGLTLFDVGAGKTPALLKKATAAAADGTTFGGLCTLSPDGKLAVLNTGAVIDLDKSGGK